MAAALTAFEWGAATLPLAGERECGDQYVVETFDQGGMVALIDALGHGPEAARAADAAAQALAGNPREDPVTLMQRCHAALRGTRGAAISIGVVDAIRRTLTWVGVGNVEGTLISADPHAAPQVRELFMYGGVVGDRLPPLSASVLPTAPGDTLILTTDGVGNFRQGLRPDGAQPRELASRILDRFAKRTDDAAVVVACLGAGR